MVFFFSQKPQCGAGRGYRVNLRVFFYNYRLCKQYPTQTHTHRRTHPAASHRVHGLDHARSCGHAAGVLL